MALYLITGVAGFIGSNIARELIKRGDKVRGIDNFATGKQENLEDLKGLDFSKADIRNPQDIASAFSGVDYVFHEAALPSVPKSVIDPVSSNDANINGTLNVLMAAREAKVKRVIYAASSSAYGETPELPKRTDMAPSPISPYAVQKLAAEHYLTAFYRCYGLETVSLRYFNIFGPHQDPTSQYSGVLSKFCTAMLRNQTPSIYGDGEQSRDFTYIDNCVQANLKAAAAPAEKVAGKVFNVATGRRVTLNETIEILRKITGYSGKVNYEPERKGDIKHSLADIEPTKAAMGYDPTVAFEQGLEKTVAWYKTMLAATASV